MASCGGAPVAAVEPELNDSAIVAAGLYSRGGVPVESALHLSMWSVLGVQHRQLLL